MRSPLFCLVALAALTCGSVFGQQPESFVVRAEPPAGFNLAISPPPRLLQALVPKGKLPPVPVADAGLPQPASLPVRAAVPPAAGPQAGQLQIYRQRDHRPTSVLNFPGEPSTAVDRDTWFATGNTYGSLSRDSGTTWTHVSPITLFAARDGGACCDQRVLFHPRSGLTFWCIQYGYSSTTATGGTRIAWANRAGVRGSSWNSLYVDAAQFGFTDCWLDYPDLAQTDAHLFFASNVFNASGQYVNSIVVRLAIAQMQAGGNVDVVFYRRTGGTSPMGGQASYRFTQTYAGNPGPLMFWGVHASTSSLKIFAWDDGSSARMSDVTRSIPSWTDTTGAAPGPDGRDWLGFDDHRIASGYLSPVGDECGFLWASNGNGSTRPRAYVRAQVFRKGDRSIWTAEDIWSNDLALAYPAVGINEAGHAGVVFSAGSATQHVTTYALLSDDYSPTFQGATVFPLGDGRNGSPTNRWGDYHSVTAHPLHPRTFVGTAMHMNGVTFSDTVHQSVWFGRDDFAPQPVTLTVDSVPAGLSLALEETDLDNRRAGITPFTRRYLPRQAYTVHALREVSVGGSTQLFSHFQGALGRSAQTPYRVDDIGTSAQSVTAHYAPQTLVTIDDRNVAATVPIALSSADHDGMRDGSTRFVRRFARTATVRYTAPLDFQGYRFQRWWVDGVAQPLDQLALDLALSRPAHLIEAEYCPFTAGQWTGFGVGCLSSRGVTPNLSPGSSPEARDAVFAAAQLLPTAPAVLSLGVSNTVWNGMPLPLGLGQFGGNFACNLFIAPALDLPLAVDAAGRAQLSLTMPRSVLGRDLYAQVFAFDAGSPWPIKLVVSNAVGLRVGGSDCR
jgi:hypothetical protein